MISFSESKMMIWIYSILGTLIIVPLIYFGSKNAMIMILYENNKESLMIIIFVLFFITFIVYLIISIKNYFFRSYQMEKIANKYNLNYKNPKKPFFEISLPSDRKSNIIEGKINGKSVLIYDYINYRAYSVRGAGQSISKSATLIFVDGEKTELRGFFTGFGGVKN